MATSSKSSRTRSSRAKSERPPWRKAAPKRSRHSKLTKGQKTKAKAAAKRAGRPYPNLVDNMRVASSTGRSRSKSKGAKRGRKKTSGRSTSARKKSSTARLKNPAGGLTEEGRRHFRRKEGARLKPGVKKSRAEMTPAETKRKGSWAVRFFGRKGKLPPLRDEQGKPTRFALTAAAWGEPVPRTVAAARSIAAKGRKLLAAYQRGRKQKTTRSAAVPRRRKSPPGG